MGKALAGRRVQAGFTLIELMMVVAIVGIIMAVVLPGYQDSVKKSRRADGRAALMELAGLQERFYAKNGTYTTTVDSDSGLDYGSTASPKGFYNLTAAACASGTIATCYVLSAAVIGNQSGDTDCAVLTMDSRTERAAKTSKNKTTTECW